MPAPPRRPRRTPSTESLGTAALQVGASHLQDEIFVQKPQRGETRRRRRAARKVKSPESMESSESHGDWSCSGAIEINQGLMHVAEDFVISCLGDTSARQCLIWVT